MTAFRECGARRKFDKPMWRSSDSPECECMQHFESAKHGEMRVETKQCGEAAIARNKVCSISRVPHGEMRVAANQLRSVDSPNARCMQHFEMEARRNACCDKKRDVLRQYLGNKGEHLWRKIRN